MSAKLLPDSTSVRILLMSFWNFSFSLAVLMISSACTSGTPAFSMVEIWRLNMEMSLDLTRSPSLMDFGLRRTRCGVIP